MNNSILEKNLEAVKKSQANIYNILTGYSETQNKKYIIENNSGVEVLYYLNENGKYIQYSSLFDPLHEAEERLAELDFSYNRNTFLLIGIALGYTLNSLLQIVKAKDKVICFEQDRSLLMEVLGKWDFSEQIGDKKLFFVVGGVEEPGEDKQIFDLVFRYFDNFVSKIHPIVLPVYSRDYISFASRIIRTTYEKKEYIKFALGNDIDDTLVGLDNYLTNLAELSDNPGINEFLEKYKDVYRGKPAIIVASGPSLNKNIDILKEAEGKALILCCDGSMEALKKRGIRIDAIGSVERIRKTYEAFYENKDIPKDTILAAPTILDPNVFKKFKKDKLVFTKRGEAFGEWMNEITCFNKGTLNSGPSVSHMMFSLAEALGAEPIILVGQDLAYSQDGFSHVKEAADVLEKIDTDKASFFVEDYEGNPLPSTYVWKQFLSAYEIRLSNYNGTVIDATEGGARIKGTVIMTLKEAVDKYCNEEVPALYSLHRSIEVDISKTCKYMATACSSISFQIRSFNLLRMKSEKALRWIDKCKAIHKKGIETQDELDYIYDCIEFAGDRTVKFMRKSRLMITLFQFPLELSIYMISFIKSDRYTIESIGQNLEILEYFMKQVKLYSIKIMGVLYIHYKDFVEMMEAGDKFPVLKHYLIKRLKIYTEDSQYDIPERVRRGY